MTSVQNDQAIKQLQLLGYKDGDSISFRAIKKTVGDEKPEAHNCYSEFPKIPSELSKYNSKFGIYLMVNSDSRDEEEYVKCDDDVKYGRAIWYEHDDMPKDQQIKLWQSLKLPEPTFQVDTGGKSIHSYWVFDEPVLIEHQTPEEQGKKIKCFGKWYDLQRDLLEYSNGDKSIKNPSRLMCLAGFKHLSNGEESKIISESGTRYTFDKLREIIPKKLKIETKNKQSKTTKQNKNKSVVLSLFVSQASRDNIEKGAAEGNRNNAGTALSRDLIGCEEWLKQR